MIENIKEASLLSGLSRIKGRVFDIKSVHSADQDAFYTQGWAFSKKLKSSVQLKRNKLHSSHLEDRVWNLFYKMGFNFLSAEGGGQLIINPKDTASPKTQIDVVAIDREVAVAIECKSSADYKKRLQFQEELGKFTQIKDPFIKSIKNQYSNDGVKKQPVFIMFLSKAILSDNDRERAKQSNVILFDDNDLEYYESLVNHLGPAAKYQILSDMLPGKEIPGLAIKIPAIKSKMGGNNCYTFSISPEFLLKIAYVSHRSKGKASDINTYQRMLTKSRLNKIRQYLDDDGVFPTNIILNFERNRLMFQKIKQEGDVSEETNAGVLGWLDIKAAYRSAWVIDGQHRLYAYSGHPKSAKSKLAVMAFEGLKPSKQAELFIDINAKQKSVKQSLLQELFAELHWDSEKLSDRVSAIISKAIQDLNNDPTSPLFHRIQTTDGVKDANRCITLKSLFDQIEKKGFFIARERGGQVLEYGPLWYSDNNLDTLKRTLFILNGWLSEVVQKNTVWWNLGSGPGGGLSMNDGVATMISILRNLFEFLEKKGLKLNSHSNQDLVSLITPYAKALGAYLATLNESERKAFRDLRGVQGLTYRIMQCQVGMRSQMAEYNPDGLDEWLNLQKQQTNKNAKELIDQIEISLQSNIIDDLKFNLGTEDEVWWYEGVPQGIRTKVSNRMEEDKNKRGGKEFYFDLLDYKKIIHDNWEIFEKQYGFGKGGKDKRTEWLDFINEVRRIVAHASSGKTVPLESYQRLVETNKWLGASMAEEVLQSTSQE
jgi:DNA sulfur modification protein DndB